VQEENGIDLIRDHLVIVNSVLLRQWWMPQRLFPPALRMHASKGQVSYQS
jgi:hypothetical protein